MMSERLFSRTFLLLRSCLAMRERAEVEICEMTVSGDPLRRHSSIPGCTFAITSR